MAFTHSETGNWAPKVRRQTASNPGAYESVATRTPVARCSNHALYIIGEGPATRTPSGVMPTPATSNTHSKRH